MKIKNIETEDIVNIPDNIFDMLKDLVCKSDLNSRGTCFCASTADTEKNDLDEIQFTESKNFNTHKFPTQYHNPFE